MNRFQGSKNGDTYQSMVQQLMRDGNMRNRDRKASPMGDIARITCRFLLTRSTKKLYRERGEGSIFLPCSLAAVCIRSRISARSSGGYRFGMSPVFRSMLMSWEIENRIKDSSVACQVCERLGWIYSDRLQGFLHTRIAQSRLQWNCSRLLHWLSKMFPT